MADSITPPMELLKHWEDQHFDEGENYDVMLTQAYQAGADQELEACCEALKSIPSPLGIPFGEMASNALRAARRPKSPSLKEQARSELIDAYNAGQIDDSTYDTIRRALETLDD